MLVMMTVNPDPTVLLLRLLPLLLLLLRLGNNRKLTHVQRHLAVSSFTCQLAGHRTAELVPPKKTVNSMVQVCEL
jgi:hypothetical protein